MTSRFASPFPPITPPRQSFFTYLLEQDPYSADHPFSIHGQTGEVVTRGQLRDRAHALACGLRNVHLRGMKPLQRGSTAVVLSPMNSMYAVYMLALGAAGICAALVNPALVEDELAHTFKVSGASHLLVDASVLPLVMGTLRRLGYDAAEMKKMVVILSADGTIPAKYKAEGWIGMEMLDCSPVQSVPERFDGDASLETAFIYFSSGTTGLSKGVELSHHNVTANLLQYRANCTYFQTGREVMLAMAPPFHVLGGQVTILTTFLMGVTVVILPRFDPEEFLRCLEQYKVTVMITVPPVLQFLTKSPLPDKYDLSSLRVITVGAAPVSPEMVVACRDRYAKRGLRINVGQGFGMTELCGVVTYMPLEYMEDKPASVGWLLPSTEGRLVDDDGVDVPIGTPGELWLRSPSALKAYANNAKATTETYTHDGWLMTGDVATVDKDGFIYITERKKELIKYKGFQVAPAELESVLNSHPDVADCAVIGVYSEEQATELPKAYIVPKDARLLTSDNAAFVKGIHDWLGPKVVHYKYLRGGITLIAEIPKSVSGKILKRKLRELEERPRVMSKL